MEKLKMKEELFRKKSLDRIKSPENLDDYIRVASPGVWLLLVSVIIILIGACLWAVYGQIDSIVPATVCVENGGNAVCYISEDHISSVQTGLTVEFAGTKGVISQIGEKAEMGYACGLTWYSALPDGFYEGKIVKMTYRPISFIIN